jgi:hypothetical protein
MTRFFWLTIAAVLSAVGLAAACNSGKLPLPNAEVDPPISVERITDRPQEYIGDRVRLAGKVGQLYGNRALTILDEDPVQKEELLVVTRGPLPRLLGEEPNTLKPGDELLVSGVIRAGNVAEIEKELGIDLDPKLESRFRGKPILVASEVVRTDARESDSPDTLTPPNN